MGVLRVDCLPVTTPRRFDLRLSFSDGSVAPAWLALPDRPAPYPAVFYAHAHGNRYGTGRDELWDGRPALACPYGPDILDLGAAIFCLEMPLFGQRRGDEAALAKAHAWRGQPLWGRMLAEAQAAFTWLAGRPIIAEDRIATLGLSMGGSQAFWLGALEPRVAAVAHLCCFADMAELIHCGAHDLHGPYLTVPGLLPVARTGQIAGLIAPRPQLVGLGAKDPLTPLGARDRGLADLRAAYGATGDLSVHLEAETGHQETPAMRRAVLRFLRHALRLS
ncbi:MAG: hypothetical protein AAFN09_03555 [Pseudomonadota bacterium]